MSLWTPGGEHEINQAKPESHSDDFDSDTELDGLPGFDDLTPEQQEQAKAMATELAEARQRLSQTPAAEVIANHMMGIYELAAIHLSSDIPNLGEAKVAIDAMSGMVSSLDGKLGENEGVIKDALQQIQMAYVQMTNSNDQGQGE
ncbi:MAG: hypothetical protein CL431_01855 [Acidimicrobiaceae bacterium]|jgi:hypothetical protein|nr:hypothetical protein [Acidimicrobiaceae bacterium]|tara:strand:- start:143728 stop:144162 length:435 start_codon:yes stop_codon:yes gene_type:complete